MKRHLVTAVVALALAPATAAAFTPQHGHYSGPTNHGRAITFGYSGHHIRDVRFGTVWAIDEASVRSSDWSFHDREYHHTIKGHWTDARHVKGTYGYYRETSRGLVHVTVEFTAALT